MTAHSGKKDIRSLTLEELTAFVVAHHEKPFRAKQIYQWIWQKNIASFDELSNVSKGLREVLKSHFSFFRLQLKDKQVSEDGTIKCAFSLLDGSIVEGVLIPSGKRMTACISSQVGCSLSCAFCATGKLDRKRNLEAFEIYDQAFYINKLAEVHYNRHLTNIVYMGMGEPLLNYKNVVQSAERISSNTGMGMSPKRVTVSTAGIAKMITKLGDDGVRFNLALSLHAANDTKRSEMMEINNSNNLETLKEALKYFIEKTDTRPTLEYIIFKDYNDQLEDAVELANWCRDFPTKINIIEYNAVEGTGFQKASAKKVDAFAQYLESRNLIVNVRRSRGKDIDAACGQLANKNAAVA